jgi:hypothetical protein
MIPASGFWINPLLTCSTKPSKAFTHPDPPKYTQKPGINSLTTAPTPRVTLSQTNSSQGSPKKDITSPTSKSSSIASIASTSDGSS